MDIGIIKKIDELIDSLEKSEEIKKMDVLKKEIYQDKELKELLDRYNKEKDNKYSTEKIELKRRIIENDKVTQYRHLEDELYLLVLSINNKLKELTEEKSCSI